MSLELTPTKVAIIAGSDTDQPAINESKMLEILSGFKISHSLSYISAHRHDEKLSEFCVEKIGQGTKIFIAIASMAAALPGALAAKTKFSPPIIGVPLIAKDGFASGLDALFAMIRMPPGIPVLTTGIGVPGLKNAALAAAQILSITDPALSSAMAEYFAKNTKEPVLEVGAKTFE